jgi:hypothetical protein
MEKGSRLSPASKSSPPKVATVIPNLPGSMLASAGM